ncbi:MAG TPA: hypothetical protein DSN98_08310 [Thermoplasmata archaeon]|jgi:hypothetical protein|nr:MAG TPA: hypothetical protein DSN98_08310 [Thermoplasmata archaeon]
MRNYDNLMNQNFLIGIPTRARMHLIHKKMGTWKYFLREPWNRVPYPLYAFVRESEADEYGEVLQDTYVKIIVVPDSLNIAQKRNEIYEYAANIGKTHVFILNDDVELFFRKESLSSKYTSKFDELMESDTVTKMLLESILLCGEQYPITGFPLKQASNNAKYMFEKNKQIIHLQCYHISTLKKEKITHCGMGVTGMSDRWVQLSLLCRGYRTITNCRYAIGDAGTGQPGGCTVVRTPALVTEAAEAVKRNFPDVVELKIKDNGKWDIPRKDCTIYLKKYLKEGEAPSIPFSEGLEMLKKGGMEF